MYRAVKVQEYVLFLEYFKLIVNLSCAQKKNIASQTAQKQVFGKGGTSLEIELLLVDSTGCPKKM